MRHGFKGFALREVKPVRVFQGAVDHVAQQQIGHIDQHQTHQYLVGIEFIAQQCRQAGPRHAAQHASQHDQQHDPATGVFVSQQRNKARSQCAHDELALGPDVPHIGTKTHCQAQRNQQERRGFDHQLTPGVGRADRFPKEHLQTAYGVFA